MATLYKFCVHAIIRMSKPTLAQLASEIRGLNNSLRELLITKEAKDNFIQLNEKVQEQLTFADKVTDGKNLPKHTNPGEVYKKLESFRLELDWRERYHASL